jgi:hypothetical protein
MQFLPENSAPSGYLLLRQVQPAAAAARIGVAWWLKENVVVGIVPTAITAALRPCARDAGSAEPTVGALWITNLGMVLNIKLYDLHEAIAAARPRATMEDVAAHF